MPVVITLICVGCEAPKNQVSAPVEELKPPEVAIEEVPKEELPAKEEAAEEVAAEIVKQKHCFRNEFPIKGFPEDKDVVELDIEITGKIVAGTYNQIPAYKDRRLGKYTGAIGNEVVNASYTFMQEGIESEAAIEIILGDDEALVSGGPPELALASTIEKIQCSE